MMCPGGQKFCPFTLSVLGAGWFLIALFIGETELLSLLPGPATPITLFGLTLAILSLFWICQSFRTWVNQLQLKTLISLHLVRFMGIYFLFLHSRGQLPATFALTAGWGDIVVALGAVLLLLIPAARYSSRAVLAWNAIGLVDILLVVATAAGLAFANRASMSALTRLPLSFLPTMIVPLIITSHIAIMFRLIRQREPLETATRTQVLA
jgi:hypothetical protein